MPAKTKQRKKKIAQKRRVIPPKQFVARTPSIKTPTTSSRPVSKSTSPTQSESDIVFFKKDFNRSMILTVIILISIVSLYGLQERGLITIADLITISAQ